MLDELLKKATESFEKSVASFQKELNRLRTGRANLALLEGIRVEYYGSPMPLTQVASVNVTDPRLITIKPWDRSLITPIEKAIQSADIGITPSNDGNVIRLPIPPLTVERRRSLVKQLGKMAEAARVAIRNIRRDFKSHIDESDELTEDDQRRALKSLQDLTDDYIEKIDKIAQNKEAEIMEQ